MAALWQDIRYGFRMLARSPGFTVVAVLVLAVGIGAVTAIVSVVRTTIFDPLPVRHAPDRYVRLVAVNKKHGWSAPGINPPALREVLGQTELFRRVAAYEYESLTLQGQEFVEPVAGLRVTPEFFRFWTLQPRLGRFFSEDEAQPGRDDVIVLSHCCWQKRFAGDPGIVGRVVQFRERLTTIIGVMPAHFSFPTAYYEYWRPFAGPQLPSPGTPIPQGSSQWLSNTGVLAELPPGVEPAQVQTFLDVVGQRQAQEAPFPNAEFEVKCRDVRELFIKPELFRTLWILAGAVTFVLLIAAADIANLQLARAQRRRQELVVRAALGAGRMRVFRQLLTENLLLAAGAGAGSLLVVAVGLNVLQKLLPPELPRLKAIHLDAGVLTAALLVTLMTGLLFGLAPAWAGVRGGLSDVLKLGAATTTRDRRGGWLGRALIVGQIATVLVLLTGAGLMVRSVTNLLTVDPGCDVRNVVRIYPGLDINRFLGDQEHAAENLDLALGDMQQRLAGVPGIMTAGIALDGEADFPVSTTAGGEITRVEVHWIGVEQADPLRALRVPLRQGRWLDRGDASASTPRILVNETAARRLWPGENPVGRSLWFQNRTAATSFEVVGVVADTRANRYDETPKPGFFRVLSNAPIFGPSRYLVVRTAAHPVTFYRAIGLELRAAGADASPPFFVNIQETLYASTAGQRTLLLYLSVLGGVGLFLAAVGLYGVLAYSVARRTREMGVRMALGARQGDVLALVLHEGTRLLGVGLVLGLAAALALGRVLRAFLFGLAPHDPLTLAAVVLLLSLVALLACYLPARRAARIDPMIALRYE